MLMAMVRTPPSQSPLLQQPNPPSDAFDHRNPRNHLRSGRNRCAKRQRNLPANRLYNCRSEAESPRVFVVSDLHTDYPENMAWVRRLSRAWHRGDVLVVAGDVAETYRSFVSTMAELKERFGAVFFVPGNHDLWCRREEGKFMNSLEKLNALLDACSELGVETGPRTIDGLGIIPLFSWYHKSFDKEKDITDIKIPSLEMACKDFHACKWSPQLSNDGVALALYFDMMNEMNHNAIKEVQTTSNHILTFSHFVPRRVVQAIRASKVITFLILMTKTRFLLRIEPRPHPSPKLVVWRIFCHLPKFQLRIFMYRQELCPEKRMLFYPNLPKIIGSNFLETRLRSIHGNFVSGSACHLFGHTHFCWDSVVDGIRYVQAPLAYPRERKRRMNGGEDWLPFCIYYKGFTDKLSPAYWSDYYSDNKREPEKTDLAPWVARFYTRHTRRRGP